MRRILPESSAARLPALLVLALLLGACTREEIQLGDAVVVDSEISVAPHAAATPTTSAAASPAPTAAAEPTSPAADSDGLFPTVIDAAATKRDGTSWKVDVTLSSEYDSPERYADAWRVLDGDDNELGIRVLTHDHAGEQPFTRSDTIEIPDELDRVFIEGRDQLNGWSGERFELALVR